MNQLKLAKKLNSELGIELEKVKEILHTIRITKPYEDYADFISTYNALKPYLGEGKETAQLIIGSFGYYPKYIN